MAKGGGWEGWEWLQVGLKQITNPRSLRSNMQWMHGCSHSGSHISEFTANTCFADGPLVWYNMKQVDGYAEALSQH